MFHLSRDKHINFAKIYKKARNFYADLPTLRKRRKWYGFLAVGKFFSLFLVLLLAILAILTIFNFVKVKLAYEEIFAGKNAAENAVSLLKGGNYDSAKFFADVAQNNFSSVLEIIGEYQKNIFIKNIPYGRDQFADLFYLFNAAEILSRTISEVALLGQSFENTLNKKELTFTKLEKAEKVEILGQIRRSEKELLTIKSDLESAVADLGELKFIGLLWPLKGKITDLSDGLNRANDTLEKILPVLKLVPPLSGFPVKATYLVMLQNSDELRPTGGFLGTYGILEVKDGDIIRFDTHDIYHMDMPVKDKVVVEPPAPLKKYLGVNRWYMRDANWEPGWPEAAKKIEWFYHEENSRLTGKNQINNFKGEFTGVFAVTPEFIADLLTLVGPIKIGNEVYDQGNFSELLEYRVEQGYIKLGEPSWQRKEVIGEIAKELKKRLFDMAPAELYKNFGVISQNLSEKNILLYFKDPVAQNQVKRQNWSGEIIDTDDDYFMVVDANMASLKTDAVINRSIAYHVEQGNNGIFADLTVKYSHHGEFDWKTTRYRTYTRVYVPAGSELIKANGPSEGEVEVKEESGKTVFSAFISIEPKKIGQLHFRYKLPEELEDRIKAGSYKLYGQKQPGSNVDFLQVEANFLKPFDIFAPTGFHVDKSDKNSVKWESDFSTDKEYAVRFLNK